MGLEAGNDDSDGGTAASFREPSLLDADPPARRARPS